MSPSRRMINRLFLLLAAISYGSLTTIAQSTRHIMVMVVHHSDPGRIIRDVQVVGINGNRQTFFGPDPVRISFTNVNVGDVITVLVNKPKYVLMVGNTRVSEVNDKIPSNPNDSRAWLRVTMAEEGWIDAQTARFYEKQSRKLDGIASLLVAMQQKSDSAAQVGASKLVATLSEDIERLTMILEQQGHMDTLKVLGRRNAENIAIMDLTTVDARAREAIELTAAGRHQDAIQRLSDAYLDSAWQEVANVAQQAARDRAQIVEGYMVKGRILLTELQFSDARDAFIKALDRDSTNVEYLWEVAQIMEAWHDYDTAQRLYEQALRHVPSPTSRIALLNSLALHEQHLFQTEKADSLLRIALLEARGLGASQPMIRDRFTAMTLNNLCGVQREAMDLRGADSTIKAALSLYRLLAIADDTYQSDVAICLGNLGIIAGLLGNRAEAVRVCSLSMATFADLARSDPEQLPNLANATLNYASYMEDNGDFELSRSLYFKADSIYRILEDKNELAWSDEVAKTKSHMGILYSRRGDHLVADSLKVEAISRYEGLIRKGARQCSDDYARALVNLARTRHDLGLNTSSDSLYRLAIGTFSRLEESSPVQFSAELASTLINWAGLLRYIGQHSAADSALQAAQHRLESLPEESRTPYLRTLASCAFEKGLLHDAMEDHELATADIRTALKYQRQAVASDSLVNLDLLVSILRIRVQQLLDQDSLHQAQECADEAWLAASYLYRWQRQANYAALTASGATRLDICRIRLEMENDTSQIKIAASLLREILDALSEFSTQPDVPFLLHRIVHQRAYFENIGPERTKAYKNVRRLERKMDTAQDHVHRARYAQDVLTALQRMHKTYPTDPAIRTDLARAYGNLSWYSLFIREHQGALIAAKKGLEIDPNEVWIRSNEVLALVYLDRQAEAEKIYLAYRDQPFDESYYWREVFLKDMYEMERAGLGHSGFRAARRICGEN